MTAGKVLYVVLHESLNMDKQINNAAQPFFTILLLAFLFSSSAESAAFSPPPGYRSVLVYQNKCLRRNYRHTTNRRFPLPNAFYSTTIDVPTSETHKYSYNFVRLMLQMSLALKSRRSPKFTYIESGWSITLFSRYEIRTWLNMELSRTSDHLEIS